MRKKLDGSNKQEMNCDKGKRKKEEAEGRLTNTLKEHFTRKA